MRRRSSRKANTGGDLLDFAVGIGILMALSGCADAESQGREGTGTVPPVTIVDSILPIEEEVRRFAEAAGTPPSRFSSDWTSVEELAEAFLEAIAARDTALLASAMVTPAEYIAFYFPHSVYMRPPYQMDPAIIWFQMISGSDRGLTRSLARFEGQDNEMTGASCAEPIRQGPNTIWESCRLRWRQEDGQVKEVRLFGPVLEREGYVKFLSYGNDL